MDKKLCTVAERTSTQSSISLDQKLCDDFEDNRAAGCVVGSLCKSGDRRLGVDVERVFSIDNGALRIAPLVEAGFGRAVLAYGPFAKQSGLAFAVYMLNGHNTAQAEPLSDSFRHRIYLWLRGSGADPRWQRLIWWFRQGRFRRTLRQIRWWRHTAKSERPAVFLDENLAVGWFASPVVTDPRLEGSGFIMHALGPENGELRAGSAAERLRSLRGVQNIPIYYVAVARTEGTVYYVSSIEGAAGLLPYPWLRPIAVDHEKLPNELYIGVQQSVLGQIGFRLDSRIYGIRVAHLPGFDSWWGGAHAADRLITERIQEGVFAEKGGQWQICSKQLGDDNSDNSYLETEMLAVLDPSIPSGLVYAIVTVANDSSSPAKGGLLWRFLDEKNHWRLELSAGVCAIVLVANGNRQTLVFRKYQSDGVSPKRLQVLDDGIRWMAYLDGDPLLNRWITDARLHETTKVGIWWLNGPEQDHATIIHAFEAHPRQLRLPDALDMGAPWLRKGTQIIVEDNFAGEAGDLESRVTLIGEKRWHRIIGKGIIEVTGMDAARVQSSIQEPCPGRTAYCVDWPYPDFVDIEVVITPPGNKRGQKQRTTAGFILYQDSKNYIILNLWRSDFYPGGSVSTFFKFNGFEDIYDAIWTNVADRVSYGNPLKLRLCCDGEHYLAFINGEAVLYRALRDVYADVERLRIHKVGLIANWEFGMDTGSEFKHFKAFG